MLTFCEFYTEMTIDDKDELPQNICETCRDSVLQSYKLKLLCVSSKITLDSIVKNYENYISNNGNSNYNLIKYYTPASNQTTGIVCNTKTNLSDGETDNVKCNREYKEYTTVLLEDKVDNEESPEDINKYACEKCKIEFSFEQDSIIHQSIHSPNLTCTSCNKSFITIKKLKRHIKTHMTLKTHLCDLCDKGFSELDALKKHIKLTHMGISRDKKYTCSVCGKKFTDQYYLNLHSRKHTGEKPLICNVCDKSFYDPRSLRVHILAHKGSKAYLCNHCGKSFVQSSHLKKHLVVHTNDKSYVCDICSKKFTQSSSLQRHKKLHGNI